MEKILVVCRSNAGRSQMAQALLRRHLRASAVRSAGTDVRAEGRDGCLLRQDIVDGGLPYDVDVSGNRRGQLMQDDLDWADHVIVTMPPEELEQLRSLPREEDPRPGDVDARRLADWLSEHGSKAEFWRVKDIRAGGAGHRSPEQIAETYAEIDGLARGWVQKRRSDAARQRAPDNRRQGVAAIPGVKVMTVYRSAIVDAVE